MGDPWFDWHGSTPEEMADELLGRRPAPPLRGEDEDEGAPPGGADVSRLRVKP